MARLSAFQAGDPGSNPGPRMVKDISKNGRKQKNKIWEVS